VSDFKLTPFRLGVLRQIAEGNRPNGSGESRQANLLTKEGYVKCTIHRCRECGAWRGSTWEVTDAGRAAIASTGVT
jgi:hypothetical protein